MDYYGPVWTSGSDWDFQVQSQLKVFGALVKLELPFDPLYSKPKWVYCSPQLAFTPAAGNHPPRSAHPPWPPTNPVTSFLFPTHRRIASSPASRVAEEETEEETEPLEAPRFWAATVLMGTRLRSLEDAEEIGGGGGHGDGVPDGDGGDDVEGDGDGAEVIVGEGGGLGLEGGEGGGEGDEVLAEMG
ncbi:hypothetical protein TIFTF001_036394 [Ficus carica]|uniref:Uncharacterized protein n=1 Tax=Ficus carica TaxID=3494 RepID=A0AA88E3A8_FICCA|nr:hypothetical protein TIFTF001_036394 [Ficus carica]